jgi:hypothetical protein
MVTISGAEPDEVKMTVELKLTDKQVNDLYEEMESYNNKFSEHKPFTRIEDYIVFLLEVLEREI